MLAKFHTSETWLLIIGGLLQGLINAGIVPANYQPFIMGMAAAILQRAIKKVINGTAPFTVIAPKEVK